MPRTFLAAGLCLALATAVPAGAAGAAGPRVATAGYTAPGGVGGVVSGDTDVNGSHYGAATVFTRRGESRVLSVSATDDAGLPVAFEISQDADGDGRPELKVGPFCGKTDTPVAFPAKQQPVLVLIVAGACGTGVSAPTTGTVTATLR